MDITYQQTEKTTNGTNKKQYVILHHTWSVWDGNIDYLCNNSAEVSCHYLVMQDGRIYQFAKNEQITRHAWKWEYEWIINNMNEYAVWIETESDWYTFTDIQKERVKELINSFDFEFELIRHKDYAPNRKRDIGDAFWNNEYSSFNEYKSNVFDNSWITKERYEELKQQKVYLQAMQKVMEKIIEDKALSDIFINETISYVNACSEKVIDINNQLNKYKG